MTKHVFFDLDDTLTKSRSPIARADADTFGKLCKTHDVIIVSGAVESQIRSQIGPHLDGSYFVLAQNGNDALDKDGTVLWRESFSDEQTVAILAFCKEIHDELKIPVSDENDLIEMRGSQISYSLIGHHEDKTKKYEFDPGALKRKAILAQRKEEVAALLAQGVEISAGGTTCFDIILAGKNKGFNVARLIEREGWITDECVYVGDAIEPGRNDESVIGVLPTHMVAGPDDTFRFIKENLLS
jgi:HAD superfamily hydrolase (TIGR01484 family)